VFPANSFCSLYQTPTIGDHHIHAAVSFELCTVSESVNTSLPVPTNRSLKPITRFSFRFEPFTSNKPGQCVPLCLPWNPCRTDQAGDASTRLNCQKPDGK
jgi:hypothetical protein